MSWFKRRLYSILEAGHPGDYASLLFDRLIIVLVLANVVAVVLGSVE